MDPEVLLKKGHRAAASYIHSECTRSPHPESLHKLLDHLLDPWNSEIDNWETIEWCKWLMAGGCTPDEFAANVRRYDNATTCGLVWTANFVAYRCRTCGISPCMSLCAECFQRGNHKGHDFNMFRSQAGGACDCGDTNVMKETGFCYLHGPKAATSTCGQKNNKKKKSDVIQDDDDDDTQMCDDEEEEEPDCTTTSSPQDSLLCVAKAMMPRLILRLIQHLRLNSSSLNGLLGAVSSSDRFIDLLHQLSSMGAAMRQVITVALTNPCAYERLVTEACKSESTDTNTTMLAPIEDPSSETPAVNFMLKTRLNYYEAITSMSNPEPPEAYAHIPSLQKTLVHRTFLEELVFWTAKGEFPQKIVCLLLNLLPDPEYKEAFTRAFVLHYSRISQLLVKSEDADTLSNRVVHVSVQLFSNEKLALKMAEEMGLLHVMVISLQYMMSSISNGASSSWGNRDRNARVVDCNSSVMKDHCYWPLVSDLNNILSHRPVAIRFLEDDGLVSMWFGFLGMFQGMNVNTRELTQHIEYEPTTYYAAFSAELEASASPMWALLSHLRDSSTAHLTKNLLRHCRFQLTEWLESQKLGTTCNLTGADSMQVSFHLPLHRYYSVFLYQAVRNQGVKLSELLPPEKSELMDMIAHPLRVQTAFYEIVSGLWVRNGLQIKGQAMTYIQCHFCNCTVDADLSVLQLGVMYLPRNEFVSSVIDKFHVRESLSVKPGGGSRSRYLEPDQEPLMLENCLIFLATLCSIRTALGYSDSQLVTLEMVTLLCMGDKTHSQLMELMPERCGNSSQSKDFEAVLERVAEYKAPNFESSGAMLQGMYVPKSFVWEEVYDPVYILLRAVHRRDFQTSLDRFSEYVKGKRGSSAAGLWAPFRIPQVAPDPYIDPRVVLLTRSMHTVLFIVFYKTLMEDRSVSEQLTSLACYLLEMAVEVVDKVCGGSSSTVVAEHRVDYGRFDSDFESWFGTDELFCNLRNVVGSVFVKSGFVAGGNEIVVADHHGVDEDGFMEVEYNSAGNEVQLPSYSYDMDVENYYAREGSTPALPSSITPAVVAMRTGSPDYLMMLEEPSNHALVLAGGSSNQPSDPNLSLVMSSSGCHDNEDVDDEQPGSSGRAAASRALGMTEEVQIGESILSILIKLHSKYSGGVHDSYVPFWEGEEAKRLVESQDPRVYGCGCEGVCGVNCTNKVLNYTTLYDTITNGVDSRVGDGKFFIAKVLDKICAKDQGCRESVSELRERIWGVSKRRSMEQEAEASSVMREELEKEERRRKARERQDKLMAEFAKKQALFMAKAMEVGGGFDEDSSNSNNEGGVEVDESVAQCRSAAAPVAYDCVICSQTTVSSNDNPVGLVTLLQASSVLGHRGRVGNPHRRLVVEEEQGFDPGVDDRVMSAVNEARVSEYKRYFGGGDCDGDNEDWLLSISGGWEGGVHVQTCGHHIHMDCLKGYLGALKSQQRVHNISVDRGEYLCPLCRQLANSFLPLSSESGGSGGSNRVGVVAVKDGESRSVCVAKQVFGLLREYPVPSVHCKMMDAMTKAMEEMTNVTSLKFRQVGGSKSPKSILLFVNSIARVNLEVEVVGRGGRVVFGGDSSGGSSSDECRGGGVKKMRSCIVPLLHVLGVHYKILSTGDSGVKLWERILGIKFYDEEPRNHGDLQQPSCVTNNAVIPVVTSTHDSGATTSSGITSPDVPVLLRDPVTSLLHLLMQLPMHVDGECFTSIVQGVYNLVVMQVVAKVVVCMMSGDEVKRVVVGCHDDNSLVGFVAKVLSSAGVLFSEGAVRRCGLGGKSVEEVVKMLVLPYLRVCGLLKVHVYEQEIKVVGESGGGADEFDCLCRFLGLGGSSSNSSESTSHQLPGYQKYVSWVSDTPERVITSWLAELVGFMKRASVVSGSLINTQHIEWGAPRLIGLPEAYDVIFQAYHRRVCGNCNTVPKEPTVCLVCGGMVCLRDVCCKHPSTGVCEAIQHSFDCGAGTVIYLSVNSSTIVVVRGRRACLWGSVFLDAFGEEDRELKRGKPLFLSKERYALLQQQWVAHRFDHTNRKWIWHRDTL